MTIQQDRSDECACRQLNANGGLFTEWLFRLDMFLSDLHSAVFALGYHVKNILRLSKKNKTRVNK